MRRAQRKLFKKRVAICSKCIPKPQLSARMKFFNLTSLLLLLCLLLTHVLSTPLPRASQPHSMGQYFLDNCTCACGCAGDKCIQCGQGTDHAPHASDETLRHGPHLTFTSQRVAGSIIQSRQKAPVPCPCGVSGKQCIPCKPPGMLKGRSTTLESMEATPLSKTRHPPLCPCGVSGDKCIECKPPRSEPLTHTLP